MGEFMFCRLLGNSADAGTLGFRWDLGGSTRLYERNVLSRVEVPNPSLHGPGTLGDGLQINYQSRVDTLGFKPLMV